MSRAVIHEILASDPEALRYIGESFTGYAMRVLAQGPVTHQGGAEAFLEASQSFEPDDYDQANGIPAAMQRALLDHILRKDEAVTFALAALSHYATLPVVPGAASPIRGWNVMQWQLFSDGVRQRLQLPESH